MLILIILITYKKNPNLKEKSGTNEKTNELDDKLGVNSKQNINKSIYSPLSNDAKPFYPKSKKENKLILIKKEKKIIQTSPKERSKLYSTTKNSLNFISEKPKLIIKKKNLQSFSSNKNYSNNYTQILIEYLKKRIALTNWYNKMMALKNSKKIRIIGRKIGEGISKNKIIKKIIKFLKKYQKK